MMVVADTSPLNYLILINCQSVLPALYERVFVPAAVMKELDDAGTPAAVRAWRRQMPEWIAVREARFPPGPTLARLGLGEREAIQLAWEEQADLLLLDEKLGMRLARRLGLTVTGTLGVLLQGARRGLLDLDVALERLRATQFRCTLKLLEQVKQSALERGSNTTDW